MIYGILVVILIAAVLLVTIKCENNVIHQIFKILSFVLAIGAVFMPNYTLYTMGKEFNISVIDLIKGITLNIEYGYSMDVKSNVFYLFLIVLPAIGIIITFIRDNKVVNIFSAIIALIGVFTGLLMVFKQIEIGSIVKLSINIGVTFMLIAYGVVLAISIIKIYGNINDERESLTLQENFEENIEKENIEDYFQDSIKKMCPKCGKLNMTGSNYCKNCGERISGE